MALGGLTGTGGGSVAGGVAMPGEPKADSGGLIIYADGGGVKPRSAKADGPAGIAENEGRPRNGGSMTGLSEEQAQKLRDFDAYHGLPSGFGDRDGHVHVAQTSASTMSDALPGAAGGGSGSTRIPLEDSPQTGGVAETAGSLTKKALKTGGWMAAAGVLVLPGNSSHDQTLTIPGHPRYRITGKESEVARDLQVANADGSWETLGTVSVTSDRNGTTVDMSQINGILKDTGFKPIEPQATSLPGAPIDGPKGPGVLSTPDQGARTADVTATPNDGPRGATVTSTPVPEEQGPQVLEASMKTALKKNGLPTEGRIRFVPDPSKTPEQVERDRGPRHGFMDKFGNEWTKGPSRTTDQAFEWDVQLSHTGKKHLGWASKDGKHVNVTPDGKISH